MAEKRAGDIGQSSMGPSTVSARQKHDVGDGVSHRGVWRGGQGPHLWGLWWGSRAKSGGCGETSTTGVTGSVPRFSLVPSVKDGSWAGPTEGRREGMGNAHYYRGGDLLFREEEQGPEEVKKWLQHLREAPVAA